ncbi:MAG: polymorphic toxin-type HINT domain-containing protein [Fuerstiella sp.]
METQNIEDIRLGHRVVGTNPLRQQTQPASEIDPAKWRAVKLNMVQGDVEYNLAFLRPLSWIEATGAKTGGSIHMELHEMGLDGQAEVISINPCPEIEPDDGTGRNVVTGTMAHPGDNILHLDITGLDEPLGVTDTHPIWSETRQDFVVAGQLEVGEQFRTLTGESATLTKIHPHRGPPEMVFNLEVDAEHVYAVAGNGLLVHNDCDDTIDLFRAVSPEEFDDIMATGGFRPGPNSLSVKQFGHDLDEVINVTDQPPLIDAAAVVRTSVPRHVFDMLDPAR